MSLLAVGYIYFRFLAFQSRTSNIGAQRRARLTSRVPSEASRSATHQKQPFYRMSNVLHCGIRGLLLVCNSKALVSS